MTSLVFDTTALSHFARAGRMDELRMAVADDEPVLLAEVAAVKGVREMVFRFRGRQLGETVCRRKPGGHRVQDEEPLERVPGWRTFGTAFASPRPWRMSSSPASCCGRVSMSCGFGAGAQGPEVQLDPAAVHGDDDAGGVGSGGGEVVVEGGGQHVAAAFHAERRRPGRRRAAWRLRPG